jgi:hypothetical protein
MELDTRDRVCLVSPDDDDLDPWKIVRRIDEPDAERSSELELTIHTSSGDDHIGKCARRFVAHPLTSRICFKQARQATTSRSRIACSPRRTKARNQIAANVIPGDDSQCSMIDFARLHSASSSWKIVVVIV